MRAWDFAYGGAFARERVEDWLVRGKAAVATKRGNGALLRVEHCCNELGLLVVGLEELDAMVLLVIGEALHDLQALGPQIGEALLGADGSRLPSGGAALVLGSVVALNRGGEAGGSGISAGFHLCICLTCHAHRIPCSPTDWQLRLAKEGGGDGGASPFALELLPFL